MLGIDVLIQRASQRHVHNLKSSAHTQHRLVHADSLLHQRNFQRISLRLKFSAAIERFLTVQSRVNIRTAAEQHSIDMLQNRGHIGRMKAILQVGQRNRNTSAGMNSPNKARQRIAELAFFFFIFPIFGSNCNHWFSHKIPPSCYQRFPMLLETLRLK